MTVRLGAVLVILGCLESARAERPAAVDPALHLAQELLATPEEQLNIANAALRISGLVLPEANLGQGNAMLDDIAHRVAKLVGTQTEPDFRIAAINSVLYRDYGFAYDERAVKSLRANPKLASQDCCEPSTEEHR